MAEPSTLSSTDAPGSTVARRNPPKIPLHKLYALPAPIRTFPLPSFYPSNPLSLVHLVYAWLSQTVFSRPRDEPSTTYRGAWSPKTRSVHIADQASMRALWEQGFFGKGSLSRSEPNWLKREMDRRGQGSGKVAEQMTAKRREERMRAKWERARLEQEVIERTRLEEMQVAARVAATEHLGRTHAGETPKATPPAPAATSIPDDAVFFGSIGNESSLTNGVERLPPVGPLQLLRLPNSDAELKLAYATEGLSNGPDTSHARVTSANALEHQRSPGPPVAADVDPSSQDSSEPGSSSPPLDSVANGSANGNPRVVNGNHKVNGSAPEAFSTVDGLPKLLKRQKSVRFSPEVKSATFEHTDPPNPSRSVSPPKPAADDLPANVPSETPGIVPATTASNIEDREHLQLSAQEAFYLSFAIGTLAVIDPHTQSEMSTFDLLRLFADYSYFPPRTSGAGSPGLHTDDPFLIHYVVYHHFRSLGWVPREGVKFGVDWLLYRRGPVFDHAEFGLLVIPSYSSAAWSGHERRSPQRQPSWHWLHGVQRVLSHVLKSLVLVYVDIPPPSALESLADAESGIPGLLEQYRVREVMVRRWSSNRNR